jgi:hypothetical protein
MSNTFVCITAFLIICFHGWFAIRVKLKIAN